MAARAAGAGAVAARIAGDLAALATRTAGTGAVAIRATGDLAALAARTAGISPALAARATSPAGSVHAAQAVTAARPA